MHVSLITADFVGRLGKGRDGAAESGEAFARVARRAAGGAAWVLAAFAAGKLLGFGTNIVLARLLTPADFGLDEVMTQSIRAADSTESAAIIRGVLNGGDGPATRIVVANAAAALWAAEAVPTLRDGVERAEAALTAGKPRAVLEALKGT